MADDNVATDDTPITFHVKTSGNAKYTLTLPLSTTARDLKSKLAGAEYANIPPENQRLIYSGRIVKDEDTLAAHKVKEGNTMHLVKNAASNQRQNPASQATSSPSQPPNASSSPGASGVPTNLATGPGNNPLAGLTGARYAGFAQLPGASMFGPDGGVSSAQTPVDMKLTTVQMGPPPNLDQMAEMMSNPAFAQMMNEAFQNPEFIDMLIRENPHLQHMGPQARQMLQSDQFRQMLTNPEAIRAMVQAQRRFGMGPFAGIGGGQDAAFPAPGETNTTVTENRGQNTTAQEGQNNQQNPFGSLGGAAGTNPFAALMNPAFLPQATSPGSQNTNASQNTGTQPNPFDMPLHASLFGQPNPQTGQAGTTSPPSQQNNPFLNNPLFSDPNAFHNMLQAMGGGAGGAGGALPPDFNLWQEQLEALGRRAASPPDNRPPEDRYAEQLRQLNEMGFYDFDNNVRALSRSGGNVQGTFDGLLPQEVQILM